MLQKRVDDQSTSREAVREAQEILHRHLKRVGLKHTEQRDTILRTFLDTREHLSTDELYRLVKRKYERIGFTTVYRTLSLLARLHVLARARVHGHPGYVVCNGSMQHYHLTCDRCLRVVHLDSAAIDAQLDQLAQEQPHFKIHERLVDLGGRCASCQSLS